MVFWPSKSSWFLWPTQILNPNSISIGSAILAQLTAQCLYFTINRPSPCQNCPFPWGDLDPIYCMVPWAHPLNPNSISIGWAVFPGLTTVTDRLTDHATQSITVGRIYICRAEMQPNNNNDNDDDVRCRMCKDREETVAHLTSECSKLAQLE